MKILIWLFSLLILSVSASAEMTVYYDKNTKEIQFVSESSRVNLSEIDKTRLLMKVLNKDIEFYGLDNPIEDYKWLNNTFILNTQKISDRVNQRNQDVANEQARRIALDSAKTKLIGLGLTISEAEALTQ